ncbi:MAG: hypothetical protein IT340_18530 [Chloroflexi bacterium]|nr:hypothetical protein [Chloroflexota bacterium]
MHTQHDLSTTTRRLSVRLVARIGGHANGSTLVAAAVAAGIPSRVARRWPGGDGLESRVKREQQGPALCPICQVTRPAVGAVDPVAGWCPERGNARPDRAAP